MGTEYILQMKNIKKSFSVYSCCGIVNFYKHIFDKR